MAGEHFFTLSAEAYREAFAWEEYRRVQYIADDHHRWLTSVLIGNQLRLQNLMLIPVNPRFVYNPIDQEAVHISEVEAYSYQCRPVHPIRHKLKTGKPGNFPHTIISSGIFYQKGYHAFLGAWHIPNRVQRLLGTSTKTIDISIWDASVSKNDPPDFSHSDLRVQQFVETIAQYLRHINSPHETPTTLPFTTSVLVPIK